MGYGDKNSFSFGDGNPRPDFTVQVPPKLKFNPYDIQMGDAYAPAHSENWGAIDRRGPGLSIGPGLMPKNIGSFIGKAGLGKAGMFGVPYLGTALAIGGALGLGKLFGRRRGPSQQQIAMDNLSRQMEGQSQAMAGYLGGLGRSMTTSGLAARDLGRSRALSALTDPNIRRMQEASLASNLGSQRAAIGPMVGMLGGGLAGSRYARGMSQFDPAMAQGLVGIGQNALANRAQAGNMLAGYGQQDIGQGLGLEQAGHQLGQGGQAQRMAYMRDRQNFDAQQAARRQGMLAQVAGLAARGATGGLFG
jgi:hypothetical protein